MSIYAPPSNIQSVFNPSNYGGLGVDGQITTNYLDANYVQFPVVQGNMTLVGTNILGDVTQQGDLTTTGDITGETIEGTSFLVGTTNLLTEIGTKQDTINDGDLTIAKTDGLQTALDNKYDDTGGTIGGNVSITGDLVVGTTNVITEIGTKQDTINDGDLTIAKTDGLQTALNNKYNNTGGSIGGNVSITGDLVVGTTNIITEIGTKQDTINDGDLTIAKTDGLQTALNNKYDNTGGTIGGNVSITGDLVIGTTNVITEIGTKQDTINDGDLTIAKTDGLQDALNNKYDDTGGTIGGNVSITGDLVIGTTNVITEIGTKQDTINDGDLTIAKTDGLQTALENKYDDTGGTISGNVSITGDLVVGTTNVITEIGTKQDTINDGDLTIAKTDGLQTALENKYDDTGGTIGGNVSITGDLVIGTTNVITELGTKQDTINDGDLTIAKTDGLQTALENKYDDTGGTIGGNVSITGDLVIGTTNVITELGTKQDTINDGDLTIAKTDGLQTALNNKYDDTGGSIGGNVSITGDLVVVTTIMDVIVTTNIITEIGTKQDTINDGDLTIAKTDGLQTALDAKQATIDEDTDLSCNSLNTSTINTSGRVDIGNAGGQSEGLVLTGEEPTITLKDTNGRSGMIHMNSDNMYFLSGVSNSEAWSQVDGEWPLILHTDTNRAEFGGQLDCDLDAFHYSAADTVLIKGIGADLSWTLTIRGSTIQNGDSFRPKYTGKYSITLCIFFGTGSSGQVKVSLKLNGSEYNLNGGSFGTNIISANDANDSGNILSGNMIVDAVAGQDIKAYVYIGTLRYYGGVSFLAGYYIGNT